MNKLHSIMAMLVTILFSMPSFAQEQKLNPERVRNQEAVYNASEKTVTITAEAPTQTEYDWDTYVQYDLTHISYITIKRHFPGEEWPDEELGRINSPKPGAVIAFVDNNIEVDRQYEYSITVFVDDLHSQQSYLQLYTGLTPKSLTSFTASVPNHKSNFVDFTFTAPESAETGESLDGNQLSIHLYKYEGMFEYSDVHTIENVTPGQTYSWRLEGLDFDKAYSFRAVPFVGKEGKGDFSEANVYIGLDYPGSPQNLQCRRQGDGAIVTWEAPALGGRGGNYDLNNTTYTLSRIYSDDTEEVVGQGIKELEYIDTPEFDEEHSIRYKLIAENSAGQSLNAAKSETISIGKPSGMPFYETFAKGNLQHKGWRTKTTQSDEAYTYEARDFLSQTSIYYFPNDDYISVFPKTEGEGMACCKFYGYSTDGQTESLVSPHINVNSLNNITIKLWLYFIPDDGSKNELQAYVNRDDGEWEQVFTSMSLEEEEPGWREISLDIDVNGAQRAQMKLSAIAHEGSPISIILDDISIEKSNISAISRHGMQNGNDGTTEYYSINGQRIDKPSNGLYIIRKGGLFTKEILK